MMLLLNRPEYLSIQIISVDSSPLLVRDPNKYDSIYELSLGGTPSVVESVSAIASIFLPNFSSRSHALM